MAAKDDYLVDSLVEMGLVTNEQLAEARTETNATGAGVVDLLVGKKVIKLLDVTRAKAAQFGVEVISLTDLRLSDEVIAAIPRHIAKRYKVVPVSRNNGAV
ncbi:MAG: GspE/PulE/PilB domain-containing protein, partial [Limisphaerales bacterium]